MGRRSKVIDLTEIEQAELERGYKYSKSPSFSRRCHFVLLKNQGKPSQEIADLFGITIQPVNRWCNRYVNQGMAGLRTKVGQGRKPILDKNKDQPIVRATIQQERQRLKKAKEILEDELNKSFSVKTLHRFLKTLAADGSV